MFSMGYIKLIGFLNLNFVQALNFYLMLFYKKDKKRKIKMVLKQKGFVFLQNLFK
jgi:hypothetical protein